MTQVIFLLDYRLAHIAATLSQGLLVMSTRRTYVNPVSS
jgi:hypothetical protein